MDSIDPDDDLMIDRYDDDPHSESLSDEEMSDVSTGEIDTNDIDRTISVSIFYIFISLL